MKIAGGAQTELNSALRNLKKGYAQDADELKDTVGKAQESIKEAKKGVDSESLDKAAGILDEVEGDIKELERQQNTEVNKEAVGEVLDKAKDFVTKVSGALKSLLDGGKGQSEASAAVQSSSAVEGAASGGAMAEIEVATKAINEAMSQISSAQKGGGMGFMEKMTLAIAKNDLKNFQKDILSKVDAGEDLEAIADFARKGIEKRIGQGGKLIDSKYTSSKMKEVIGDLVSTGKDALADMDAIRAKGNSQASGGSAGSSVSTPTPVEGSSEGGSSQAAAEQIQEELDNISQAIDDVNSGGDAEEAAVQVGNSLDNIDNILEESGDTALTDAVGEELGEIQGELNPIVDQITGQDLQETLEKIEQKLDKALSQIQQEEKELSLGPDLLGEANARVASLMARSAEENTIDQLDLSEIGQSFMERSNRFSSVQTSKDGSVGAADQDAMLGSMGDKASANRAAAKAASRYQEAQSEGLAQKGAAANSGDKLSIGDRSEGPADGEGAVEGAEGEGAVAEGGKKIDMKAAMDRAGSQIEGKREAKLEAAKEEVKAEQFREAETARLAALEDSKPVEETKPSVDPVPVDIKPIEPTPVETKPLDSSVGTTEPVQKSILDGKTDAELTMLRKEAENLLNNISDDAAKVLVGGTTDSSKQAAVKRALSEVQSADSVHHEELIIKTMEALAEVNDVSKDTSKITSSEKDAVALAMQPVLQEHLDKRSNEILDTSTTGGILNIAL